MKKLFTIATLVASIFVVSCSKDEPKKQKENSEPVVVTKIQIAESFSLAINSNAQVLPVTLTPAEAVLTNDIRVSCTPEDVISYSVVKEGIKISPKKVGEATLTVAPKTGPASAPSCKVIVTEKPAEPVSVSIVDSGSQFSGGSLMLTEGEVFKLTANVKNELGATSTEFGVTWSIVEGSDYIELDSDTGEVTAKAISGTSGVTASVKAVVNGYSSLSDQISIKIAAISAVFIDRSADNVISESIFSITEGGSFTLEAKAYNSRDEEISTPIKFEKTSGDSKVSVSENGKVSAANGASQDTEVRAYLTEKPSIEDFVTVKIVPLPSSVSFSNFSGASLNSNEELIMAEGQEVSFKVSISPSISNQAYKYSVSGNDNNTLGISTFGDIVTLKGLKSKNQLITLTIYAPTNEDIAKKSLKIYVFDYDKSDIKSGDYVYYNSSAGFRAIDCGLRYANGTSSVYQDDSGNRVSSPKAYPGSSFSDASGSWNYLGVVVTTDIPADNDFLGTSYLSGCKDGSNATGLYQYRTFTKNNLNGFYGSSSTHALVLFKSQTSKVVWQDKNEFIAMSEDKKDGKYQFQLTGSFAFSPEACSWINQKTGKYQNYCESGFVPHLLLKYYTNNLNNSDYSVIPILLIEQFTVVPKLSANKGTTGLFLPGEMEWGFIKDKMPYIKASLSESSLTALDGYYWSTEEDDQYYAYSYKAYGNYVNRYKQKKDNSDIAQVCSVFYL